MKKTNKMMKPTKLQKKFLDEKPEKLLWPGDPYCLGMGKVDFRMVSAIAHETRKILKKKDEDDQSGDNL